MMHYEKMNEPIEMIAHFAPGRLQPLRFLWKGRAHKIEAVRGRWTTLEGQRKSYRFAIHAEGIGGCELAFELDTMLWSIQTIAVDS
jgi:hypothetical protein